MFNLLFILTPRSEMEEAVNSAQKAFKTWSNTSVMRRQEIIFNFREIMKKNLVSGKLVINTKFLAILKIFG